MRVQIENPDGKQEIIHLRTDHSVVVEMDNGGKVTVGTFADGTYQVVLVRGKKETTMIKFNERSLL